MTFDSNTSALHDDINRQILYLIQEDARMPYAEIGRRVGLTAPSVAERIRRLEEAGIITGYHAAIDLERFGLPVTVYIQVTSGDGRCDLIERFVNQHPAVSECYCITGDRDILIKASFASLSELEEMVQQLLRYGRVSTSVVLSKYRERRSFA
jgi:Lrp/AsnC family leucine-responsive transcriptional regulator